MYKFLRSSLIYNEKDFMRCCFVANVGYFALYLYNRREEPAFNASFIGGRHAPAFYLQRLADIVEIEEDSTTGYQTAKLICRCSGVCLLATVAKSFSLKEGDTFLTCALAFIGGASCYVFIRCGLDKIAYKNRLLIVERAKMLLYCQYLRD